MTAFDELVLQLAVPKVQAWERLNDPGYTGRLTMGQIHDLMIEAGYPVESAQEVAKERGWARLDAGEVM